MQVIVPLSQRAALVPPTSDGFRSLYRKATASGWWLLLLLLSLSGRLGAQQANYQRQPSSAVQVVGPKVDSFTLINAATGQVIQSLQEGDVLDLAALPAQLSVRANTEPWQVGSVVFGLNNQPRFRVENFSPYALASNQPDSRFIFLSQFGSQGGGEGQFSYPQGVAVDGRGHVYIADNGNSRIQEFDSTGRFLSQFGTGASGVAVDGRGHLYVADQYNHHL